MSTVQQTKPRCANQSMTDESGRPGTVRSNVGCEAIDEPWTNNSSGLSCGESTNFSQRKRRTSPLCAQCSTPSTRASLEAGARLDGPIAGRAAAAAAGGLVNFRSGLANDFRPLVLLGARESPEFGGRRSDRLDAGLRHITLGLFVGKDLFNRLVKLVHDTGRCVLRCEQSQPYV